MCKGQCLCPGPCPRKIVSVNSIFQQKTSTPMRGGGGGGKPSLNINDSQNEIVTILDEGPILSFYHNFCTLWDFELNM